MAAVNNNVPIRFDRGSHHVMTYVVDGLRDEIGVPVEANAVVGIYRRILVTFRTHDFSLAFRIDPKLQ